MKKLLAPGLFLLLSAVLLAGCMKDSCLSTYTIYQPVFKSLTEVRAEMKSGLPRALEQTGKLYIYGQYIFLNEVNRGIHVIDNSNPSAPRNISFIAIPGNVDLAVRGSYLYADSYSDMVVFDISNPANVTASRFVNNVFEDRNMFYWGTSGNNPDSVRVMVDYVARDTTVECETYNHWTRSYCGNCAIADSRGGVFFASAPNAAAAPGPSGMGGSMARFAVVDQYLYSVTMSKLKAFDLAAPAAPELKSNQQISAFSIIETIYPFGGNLFIGSTNGMFIFDLANPVAPAHKGQFGHVRSCDPVIADNEHAYVTLRSGTRCQGFTNQMEVLSITNLSSPRLVKTYELSNPHGLSKDGHTLLVCDGSDGLKVYDASRPAELKLLEHIRGIETYDVIALNGNAIVVAKDGLYQYDYSDPSSLRLRSKMSVSR